MSAPTTNLATGSFSRPARRRRNLFARLMGLLALRRQRRQLKRLDAARLHDLGISREEACIEAARKLWDVPPGWRI